MISVISLFGKVFSTCTEITVSDSIAFFELLQKQAGFSFSEPRRPLSSIFQLLPELVEFGASTRIGVWQLLNPHHPSCKLPNTLVVFLPGRIDRFGQLWPIATHLNI